MSGVGVCRGGEKEESAAWREKAQKSPFSFFPSFSLLGPKYFLLPRSFSANEERSPPSSSSSYSDPSPDRKTELVISRIDYEEEEEEAAAFPRRHRWRKWLELEQFSGLFLDARRY